MTCMAINDTILLVFSIIFTFLQLLITGVLVFVFITYMNKDAKKQREIRKKLEEKAKTDPYAKKRLDKMNRKRKKSIKQELIEKAVSFAVLAVLFIVNFSFFFLPAWTDYVKKDYVVYEGRVQVDYYRRHYYTHLDDGKTTLTGSAGLSEGEHNVTIVYSKRSEIVLDLLD